MTVLAVLLVVFAFILVISGFGAHIQAFGEDMFGHSGTRSLKITGWIFWVLSVVCLVSGLLLLT